MRSMRPLTTAFLFLLASHLALAAEAIIQGKVHDQEGKGVAAVKITVADKSSGRSFKGKTDEDGKFYIRGIVPADYEVVFEKEGYTSHTWNGHLGAGKAETIDVTVAKKGAGGGGGAPAAPGAAPGADQAAAEAAAAEMGKDFNDAVEKYRAKDYDGAIALFRKVSEKRPELPDPYFNIGLCYEKKKDFASAVASLEKALEKKPDHAGAYFNLGFSQFARGKNDAGAQALAKTVELDPRADTAYNAGAVFKNYNLTDKAMEMFQKAVALDATYADAQRELGFIYVGKGDSASAKAALQKYLELAPTAPDAQEVKAMLGELK